MHSFPRTVLMLTALWQALVCALAGLVLAAVSGLAWHLGTGFAVPHEAAPGAAAFAVLLSLGGTTGGLAGGFVALAYQLRLRRLRRRLAEAEARPSAKPAEPLALRISKHRTPPRLRACVTAHYRWESLSPALCQVLRRSARSLRGRPVLDVLHPEDLGIVDQALRAARTAGSPQSVVCRVVLPIDTPSAVYARTAFRSDTQLVAPLDPASIRHVRLQIRARPPGPRGPAGFFCRFTDVTTRVRQEQAVEQSRQATQHADRKLRRVSADLSRLKESYRELYHHAPVMYFSLDVDGRLVTFNDTLIRTLGYRREQLAQHSYADLLVPVPGRPAGARGQPPFEGGEVEARWRKQDGVVLDVWIRTVAVLDERGGFVRYRSSALDLTEKNRLANELRARRDELEGANERLRAINSELEDFTYVVSHDLKEPLRTLQTYGHLLAEEYSAQLGTDGFQYINHLIRASRRLGLLIDDLLNLSQVGRTTRAPQGFDLIEAVATARQDLADLIQRKEATVLTEGSLPRVAGDRHRITQLLTNLIANGLKYNASPQPGVIVAAVVRAAPSGTPEVLVSIRDNGIGIDPAYHEQIFGIFRRLHQSDEYEGTGAGLAICKKIVASHGGRIWVESQPGQGATFFFTVPHAPEAAPGTPRSGLLPRPADDAPSPQARTARLPAPAATGMRVVLVEDDPETAHVIQRLGQMAGLAFTWFPTAEEAWAYLQGQQPDLLLFDIQLPGMDGVELCRRARTVPALRATPIALFVRDQTPERVGPLRAAGADFFLSKDLLVNPALWQQKLQEVLDQARRP